MLKDAVEWTADRLDDVSTRLHRQVEEANPTTEEPGTAKRPSTPVDVEYRPPAPVTGDAGARAAGSVEDDITDQPTE